jgi:cytosine deaminase
MLAAGINVALGHDDIVDPWYPLGSHDMLEVAHMGVHALHMSGTSQMEQLFDAVTRNAARILNLEGYGLEPGCYADMVILQAPDPIEALRLRATRLNVIRRGRVIAESAPQCSHLCLGDTMLDVDFSL